MTEQAHQLIKELYILSVPKFNTDGSIYPVCLEETDSMLMYHHSIGNHLGHDNYVYNKLCKSSEKSKIKNFNSPRNKPLIFIGYWSKNIEEYFHLNKTDKINLSLKSTPQDAKNVMNTMVKHFKSMEQGMIEL